MSTRNCPVCERSVTGAVLDQHCTSEIIKCLTEIPDLLAELEVNVTRQAKTAPRVFGGRSAEVPLPYGLAASDAIRQLTDVLRMWASAINPTGRPHAALTAAAHLRSNINHIRQHDLAEKIYEHITRARAHAYDVIDREADLIPVGQCGEPIDTGDRCTQTLYADPDRSTVKCPTCQAIRHIDRTWMFEGARHLEWTATEISAAAGDLLTASAIRGYARYRHITAVGERLIGPERTVPTYRVGDVLDVWRARMKDAG